MKMVESIVKVYTQDDLNNNNKISMKNALLMTNKTEQL